MNEAHESDPLDELYGMPLDEFVSARNRLAGDLEAAGEVDRAARIRALRKPTISAWVVNQLVRADAETMRRLIEAGIAMEEAQREALSGRPADFETARREERAAIDGLRASASDLVPGLTPATLERVTNSLIAGVRSADGRASLSTGRLTVDLEPRGFDAYAGFPVTPPAPTKRRLETTGKKKRPTATATEDRDGDRGPPSDEHSKRIEELQARRRSAVAEALAAAANADDADRRADEAHRVAEQLASEAAATRRAAEEARQTLDDIDEELRTLGVEES